MKSQTIALLAMLAIFIIYISSIWLLKNDRKEKRGPLDSISDSVKVLKGISVAAFSLFAIGLAVCLAWFLEISGWFFIPMICLALLSATPYFYLPHVVVRHIIAATGIYVSLTIIAWALFNAWWILPAGLALSIAMMRPKFRKTKVVDYAFSEKEIIRYAIDIYKIDNYTWWNEISWFVVIWIALFIR